MSILNLDLGTKTGWAVIRSCGEILWGTQSFQPGRYEGGGMRYLRFAQWLDEMYSISKIEAIHFEEVRRHIGTDAAHVYGGFLSHVSAWAEGKSIPYLGVPVQTIKKFATGKGNAKKEMVIQAVRDRGYTVHNDNEADAVALALYIKNKMVMNGNRAAA